MAKAKSATKKQPKKTTKAIEPEIKDMKTQLGEARKKYTRAQGYAGGVTFHCGDKLASALSGLEPFEVCLIADMVMDQEEGFYTKKYGHLNPGQVRMNAGNRLRAAAKKDTAVLGVVEKEALRMRA